MRCQKADFLSDFEVYSVTEQIADHIKQSIIYGNIRVGEKLPSETEMATRLNVSRNTIREALKMLSDDKLIETRPGRTGGHYVSTITEQAIKHNFGEWQKLSFILDGMTLEEVIEIRRIIEVKAAYLAALRRTDEDLQRLRESIDFLNDEPLSDLLFCKNNYVFNKYIALATKNRLIQMAFTTISRIIVPLFKYIDVPFSLRTTLNDELDEIYQAILKQNPDMAATVMSNHLYHFEEFFFKDNKMLTHR